MKNVLLLGGGWVAKMVYVPFLNLSKEIHTIYIVDIDFKSAQENFSEYEKVKIINQDEIDHLNYQYVCILTPNYLHSEKILFFLKKNVNILVEKPLCISIKELEEIKKALLLSSSTLNISAPLRYREDLQEVKKFLYSDKIGDVYHVEISWIKRRGTPGSSWFTKKEFSGGGVLIDMGPHLFDLFYWIFGSRNIERALGTASEFFLKSGDAYADWHRNQQALERATDVEDSLFSLITYQDKSLSMNLAWASNIENDYASIKAFGKKGVLEVTTSIGFSTNALHKKTTLTVTQAGDPEIATFEIEDRKEPFRKMIADFIKGEKNDLPDGVEAIKTMNDIFNLYKNSSFLPLK